MSPAPATSEAAYADLPRRVLRVIFIPLVYCLVHQALRGRAGPPATWPKRTGALPPPPSPAGFKGATVPAGWDAYEAATECPARGPNEERTNKTKKLLYYHIQHHGGTAFSFLAKSSGECLPRICGQVRRECWFSYSESVEAARLLASNLTTVTYEAPLPAAFPFPFVAPEHRAGFMFVTTMRDPLQRLLSAAARQLPDPAGLHPRFASFEEFFMQDFAGDSYAPDWADNLALRWLAGVRSPRPLTRADLTLAKCRLRGFDLVLTDESANAGAGLLCRLRGWAPCDPQPFKFSSPADAARWHHADPGLMGAVVERHRLSFELYDYARRLSARQLAAHGVEFPDRSKHPFRPEPPWEPSIMRAFAKYSSMRPDAGRRRYGKFYDEEAWPEEPVCDGIHRSWAANPDLPPLVEGLDTIAQAMFLEKQQEKGKEKGKEKEREKAQHF